MAFYPFAQFNNPLPFLASEGELLADVPQWKDRPNGKIIVVCMERFELYTAMTICSPEELKTIAGPHQHTKNTYYLVPIEKVLELARDREGCCGEMFMSELAKNGLLDEILKR